MGSNLFLFLFLLWRWKKTKFLPLIGIISKFPLACAVMRKRASDCSMNELGQACECTWRLAPVPMLYKHIRVDLCSVLIHDPCDVCV